MDTPALPTWLVPDRQQTLATRRELEHHRFEMAFERMMDIVATGQPLTAALETYPFDVEYTRFMSWIHRDEARKMRLYESQAIGAEVIADQMMKIADASDSFEDVQRSTLRINTRKWLLGVWNRKRFGETKQIEQNVTIDIGEAMAAAQQRVAMGRGEVIDVEARSSAS